MALGSDIEVETPRLAKAHSVSFDRRTPRYLVAGNGESANYREN